MKRISFLQRLVNLFLAPGEAFDDFVEGVNWKDWVYPLIIVTASLVILPLFFRDITIYEAEDRLVQTERKIAARSDIPEEQLELIQGRLDKARDRIRDMEENPWALRHLWGYLLIPVVLFILTAAFAGILMGIGNFGMGEKVKFFQVFSVVMLTYLIGGNGMFLNIPAGVGTLELVVKTPLILMKGSTDMLFSPGLLFEDIDSFVKAFLNQLDVFRIWAVIVLGMGFAKLYRKSTQTGIIAVGIPWLILVALASALSRASAIAG